MHLLSYTFTTCGLLVHNSLGATLCILRIPILHGERLDIPELEVDAAAARLLTSYCVSAITLSVCMLGGNMVVHPC